MKSLDDFHFFVKMASMKSQKITKSKEKYKDTFTAHEVGVILENLNDKFDLLTEKLDSHDEIFENIENKLVNLTDKVEIIAISQTKTLARVTALEAGQKLLMKRIESVENKLEVVEVEVNRRFDKIDQRLNHVELDIRDIKDSIKTLVDLDKFYVLEKRVTKLENHVASFLK